MKWIALRTAEQRLGKLHHCGMVVPGNESLTLSVEKGEVDPELRERPALGRILLSGTWYERVIEIREMLT